MAMCDNFILFTAQNPEIQIAYFLKACAFCQLESYSEAFDTLRTLVVNVEVPMNEVYSLNAFVACKLVPPQLDQAVDSYNILIKNNPKDFKAVS
jgi:hypothetical protein